MNIDTLLQLLLILVVFLIIKSKNNLRIVIAYSVFSLIVASLYFIYKAPDVALAEIAVGSAIVPLIFILAISKQNEFIVVSHLDDDFLKDTAGEEGIGYTILLRFCKHFNLKLKIYKNLEGEVQGIFRKKNVDLIVEKHPKSKKYLFKGKEASVLMSKLKSMTEEYGYVKVVGIEEDETDEL